MSVEMATITFRIPEDLREQARAALLKNDLTTSAYLRSCLEYVVETGRPAVRRSWVRDQAGAATAPSSGENTGVAPFNWKKTGS